MRGKQGCPLSSTLFGLCIDNLKENREQGCKRRRIRCPKTYVDGMIIFSYDVDDKQCLLGTLSTLFPK